MPKLSLNLLTAFLTIQLGYCQPPEYLWTQAIKGTGGDMVRVVQTDAQGNCYVAGVSNGTVDFDPGAAQLLAIPTGTNDIVFVCKLNSLGQLQWAKWLDVYDGYVTSLCTDNAGSVYVAGAFTGTADFDPSINTHILSTLSAHEFFLWKLDAQGSFQTVGTLGDASFSEAIIKIDGNQKLYCSFSFTGSRDLDPGLGVSTFTSASGVISGNACLLKLDLNLNLQWAGMFPTTAHSEILDFEFDNPNNLIVSLRLAGSSTADIDPGPANFPYTPSAAGPFDLLVLKIIPGAGLVWHSKFVPLNPGSQIHLNRLVLNSINEVFLAGVMTGTIDANPGTTPTNTISTPATTVFTQIIVRLNQSGNFVSHDTLNVVPMVLEMVRDTMVIGGNFSGSVDLDPSTSVSTVISAGGTDVFLFGLTENYQLVWKHTYGGNANDALPSIALSDANELYAVGLFSGTADFDPGSASNLVAAQAGFDGYLSKFSPCKELPLNLSASAVCAGQNATLVAISPAAISWYSVGAGGTPVGTGSVYITPPLTAGSHTVFVASETCSLLPRSLFVTQAKAAPALTVNVVSQTVCAGQAVSLTAGGAHTYSWTSGPATPVYTVSPTADISYSVIGTYTDTGCSSMASVSLSVSDCSGISELEANALQVFPNPTHGCFYVNAANATISIYNTAGECVSTFEHHLSQYDCVPGLSPGIYYLVISGYNQILRLAVVN